MRGRITFRNEIYGEYKANRSEPPEELVPQFPLVRMAAEAIGLPMLEMEGFEADDLIASYALKAEKQGMPCLIVSSDKDLMQLVRGDITMLDPMKNRPIGADEVVEKFGVTPDKVVDVQALAGDSTDNVPGVPGIGVKTAAELINQFGDLESLLAGAESIKQPKRRENLINFAEQARLSRQLVLLKDDVDLPIDISALTFQKADDENLMGFLAEQGFKSLIAALGGTMPAINENAAGLKASNGNADAGPAGGPDAILPPVVGETDYQLITDIADLESWIDAARKQGFVAIDTETSSLDAARAQLVGVAMAIAAGRACYIPLRHVGQGKGPTDAAPQGGLDFSAPEPEAAGADAVPPLQQIDFEAAIERLRELFADPSVLKIGHNLKYDMHVLSQPRNGGLELTPVEDTMCLSYVLDAGRSERHGLDPLALNLLQVQTIKYEDVCGKGAKQISFAEVSPETACAYASEDADICLRLWMMYRPASCP
jgi:DNA polymerase-1